MALYTAPARYYVDSQLGTGSATGGKPKVNVPVNYDTKYHKKAQTKIWWKVKNMIGATTYASGSLERTDPALPVMSQTDFKAKKGDTLIINQQQPMSYDHLATTMVGNSELINNEQGWGENYQKVKIEEERTGLLTYSGMNEHRSPYDESQESLMDDKLADWTAQSVDTGILYAAHYGQAPHYFRTYGHSSVVPAANYHTLYGNDATMTLSRTIANISGDGSDNISPDTFEIAYSYAKQNNMDLVNTQGGEYLVALVSPKGMLILRRNSDFKSGVTYARERGIDNPLFKISDAMLWGNCIIMEYDKIRSILGGYNPAGLTVANEGAYNATITETAFTGIGDGVASTELHQTYFLGARALILAEASFKSGIVRNENDYGKIVGRASHNIWNAKRNDWLDEAGAADNYANLIRIVNTIKL